MSVLESASTRLEAAEVRAETIGAFRVNPDGTATHEAAARAVATLQARQLSGRNATDFRRWSGQYLRVLLAAEALIGMAAVFAATLFPRTYQPDDSATWLLLGGVGGLAWPLWIAGSKGYSRSNLGGNHGDLRAVVKAAVVLIMIIALPTAWLRLDSLLATVAVAVPAAAIASAAIRYGSKRRLLRVARRSGAVRKVIMVGSPEPVHDLMIAMEQDKSTDMRLVGVCVPAADADRARAMGLPVVGDIDHVAYTAARLNCHAVTVAGAYADRQNFLRKLLWSLEGVDTELLIHPGLVEVAQARLHVHGTTGLPLLRIQQPRFTGWHRIVKRAVDISLTSIGLLAMSPLLAIVALAIKIDDRGPVIFRQTRVGIDGNPFTMYKFRSMCTDAEARLADLAALNQGAGPLFKLKHDPRVTRVGRVLRKTSLDELPQLFNVLLGNMSLVGPRPPLQSEVDRYGAEVHRRLKVLPGITGLWQVSGRSLLSWEESVRLDLRYVENWSLGLDLAILAKTVRAVTAKKGAF